MSRKLRILEVNKAYYPHVGGIESLVKQYAENFSDRADVKVLVCREDRGKSFTVKVNGVEIVRSGSFGTYFSCPLSLSFIMKFRKMAKNADVVHINVPFPLADLACLLSGYEGRVVVSWHSDVVKQKKLLMLYKPLMMRFLKRADLILAATEGHIKSSPYISVHKEKCRIVPYSINVKKYLEAPQKPVLSDILTDKKAVKVFFTGRLVYYKGVDVLINAFRNVKNCELFIAGTGKLEKELKEYTSKHGMNDRVHFLGFLPDEELKAAFRDCDIFVLPSVENSEAFGIVQLEAMVYSKPVINTALPTGVPYVSLDGESGITVKPNDANALSEAINKLAENKELRESYGREAYNRVCRFFDDSVVLDRIYDALSMGGKLN